MLQPLLVARQRMNQLLVAGLVFMTPGVVFGIVTDKADIVQACVVVFGGWMVVAMIFQRRRLEKACAEAGRTRAEVEFRLAWEKYRVSGATPDHRRRIAVTRRWLARVLTLVSAVAVAGAAAYLVLTITTAGMTLGGMSTNPALAAGIAALIAAFAFVVQVATQTRRIRWADDELAGREPVG